MTIVLATASSDAVLPQIMRKLEALGVKKSVSASSFHRLFLQSRRLLDLPDAGGGVHRAGDQHAAVVRRPAAGARRLPDHVEGRPRRAGSAIVILAATLNACRVFRRSPRTGAVVDWFIGMARALGNLIGNCIATVVIAAWEGDLDRDKARRVLREPNWWMSRRVSTKAGSNDPDRDDSRDKRSHPRKAGGCRQANGEAFVFRSLPSTLMTSDRAASAAPGQSRLLARADCRPPCGRTRPFIRHPSRD